MNASSLENFLFFPVSTFLQGTSMIRPILPSSFLSAREETTISVQLSIPTSPHTDPFPPDDWHALFLLTLHKLRLRLVSPPVHAETARPAPEVVLEGILGHPPGQHTAHDNHAGCMAANQQRSGTRGIGI